MSSKINSFYSTDMLIIDSNKPDESLFSITNNLNCNDFNCVGEKDRSKKIKKLHDELQLRFDEQEIQFLTQTYRVVLNRPLFPRKYYSIPLKNLAEYMCNLSNHGITYTQISNEEWKQYEGENKTSRLLQQQFWDADLVILESLNSPKEDYELKFNKTSSDPKLLASKKILLTSNLVKKEFKDLLYESDSKYLSEKFYLTEENLENFLKRCDKDSIKYFTVDFAKWNILQSQYRVLHAKIPPGVR